MNELIESGYKYGMPIVYSVVLLLVIYKLVVRFLDSYERRETVYSKLINEGMANMNKTLQDLSADSRAYQQNEFLIHERMTKDIKDGFDRLIQLTTTSATYQREEHKEILEKIEDSEKTSASAREQLLNAIRK